MRSGKVAKMFKLIKILLAFAMLRGYTVKSYKIETARGQNQNGLTTNNRFNVALAETSLRDNSMSPSDKPNELVNVPFAKAKISYNADIEIEQPLPAATVSIPLHKPGCKADPKNQTPEAKCTCGLHRPNAPIALYSFVLDNIPKENGSPKYSSSNSEIEQRSKRDLREDRKDRVSSSRKQQKKIIRVFPKQRKAEKKSKSKVTKRNTDEDDCPACQEDFSKVAQMLPESVKSASKVSSQPTFHFEPCPLGDECSTIHDVIIKNFHPRLNGSESRVDITAKEIPSAQPSSANVKRFIDMNPDTGRMLQQSFGTFPSLKTIHTGTKQQKVGDMAAGERQTPLWQIMYPRNFQQNLFRADGDFAQSTAVTPPRNDNIHSKDNRANAALDAFIRYTIGKYPKFFADSYHSRDSLVSPTQREDTIKLLSELILNRVRSWFSDQLDVSNLEGENSFNHDSISSSPDYQNADQQTLFHW